MSQINDLLEDPEFIRWVKSPEKKLNKYWQSWMEANPERIADIKLAREMILGLQFPSREASEYVKKQVLNRLLLESNFNEENSNRGRSIQKRFNSRGFSRALKIAAILVFTILLPVLYYNLQKPEEPTFAISQKWITKSTNWGEKITFRLPDGTMVWLNSGSSLMYPEVFNGAFRDVQLKGEGFFEVVENVNKPFKVASGGLVTTALGTSFNINSTNTNELKVSLVTGKVLVNSQISDASYFLDPGQELDFSTGTREGTISTFNTEAVQGWREGKLIFRNSSFDDVRSRLEQWYGVEITVAGAYPKDWSFTGKFENQSLEMILESMSSIEAFEFKIDKKAVSINF